MDVVVEILRVVGLGVAAVVVTALCLSGVVLSCLSISGTWLVVLGTVIAAIVRRGAFPGFWTILVFVVLSALVEVAEAFAGTWGVVRKGGSRVAGVAALAGGVAGMVLGALIPIPVFGPIIGMLAGGFLLVYVVERHRLKASGKAADIAWGVVVSRVFVTVLKVVVTLGMIGSLSIGILTT